MSKMSGISDGHGSESAQNEARISMLENEVRHLKTVLSKIGGQFDNMADILSDVGESRKRRDGNTQSAEGNQEQVPKKRKKTHDV
jgi:hypothetical protein